MSSTEERLAWARTICQQAGLRVTPVRRAILDYLAGLETPVTLERVKAEIHAQHDAATIYRTLKLFVAAGLLRVVGTPLRSSHYLLNPPGAGSHFLVCGTCGRIASVPISAEIFQKLQAMAAESRFATACLSLEIHGCCSACERERLASGLPSKLPG